MTRDEMLEILETLAHGADPETGEVLPDTSPYNDARVVRALFLAIGELRMREPEARAPRDGKRSERETHGRAGQAWTAEEERELADEFDQGIAIDELPRGTSARAVRSRRG